MPLKTEQQKAELIDQVAATVGERLPRDRAETAGRFVRMFYKHVPPDDILNEKTDDLYGAALSLWQFGAHRRPGAAKIRVYSPNFAEHGWHSSHTVIEIVNDDMPFLVDSVTQALTSLGLGVHLVIHPVVRVERDAAGNLKVLYDPATAPAAIPANVAAESFMHIVVDERKSAAAQQEIRDLLAQVLADVRAAVEDWPKMRAKARELADTLRHTPPPVPADEATEGGAFLRWMHDDNFTFLGYREYGFRDENGQLDLKIVPGSGLGILRAPEVSVFEGMRQFTALPPDIQQFMRQPRLVMVTKGNRRSMVHRHVPLDVIIVKIFDPVGQVTGERLFVGLFTSIAYHSSARDIPFLRRKVARVLARAGLDPNSHDGKTLTHILDTYPRDELFQATDEELLDNATGILHLQERLRTALFTRRDPYGRFVSCLVYVPRDRYNTALRERFQEILERAFGGTVSTFYTQVTDQAHARIHYIIDTAPGQIPDIDTAEIEARLIEAGRSWTDLLQEALIEAKGEEQGLALSQRYVDAFPTAYREATIAPAAIIDIERIEEVLASGDRIGLNLFRPIGAAEHKVRFKLYHAAAPVPLSDVLPMLENMGFRVIAEVPQEVTPAGAAQAVWIHDFTLETRDDTPVDLGVLRQPVQEAFARVWEGAMENDGFNRLVLSAGLSWRQIVVLRAYAKFLRQARFTFSQEVLEATLAAYPQAARLIAELFTVRFDPALARDRDAAAAAIGGELEAALDRVDNLDEDRILRQFIKLCRATLRTNFYQTGRDGTPKPYLALKLDSRALDVLPLPRPMVEIFVYSPRVEAVHLRGGKVARGGIRWSDRRDDFRTEILGLMKAQMVKNAVIVPVGAKGGFVVKRPLRTGVGGEGGRDALQAEGIECYKTLMRGLLDLTDNLNGGRVTPPPQVVVQHDGDDPYLVVAADKGTATFSDIANGVAAEYGFWLGDAFASGGSAGYDHKRMGITARGAWESVKRHFREMGIDIQEKPFTVVGVGDMSGDVFGNAMLLSPQIRLLAAFNHLHIFVDPNPDPGIGFQERRRLFELGRGSWDSYDRSKISVGGAVFDRKAKALKLSPQIRERFGIAAETVTPNELIAALLQAETDLLWFGGIGTFVKAADESHAEVGDKANDALRVDAETLRAKVIGEGANLAVTQRGRIAFARKGGRINTDFIDNSAGVDTSDHEVNIKILLNRPIASGDMTVKHRNQLLDRMTDEIAWLAIRDNYLQTQALSMTLAEGAEALDQQARMMKALERSGRLNRAVERLPDDEELTERLGRREGLTRPELAVLLSYAKIALNEAILAGDLPDDPGMEQDLLLYFPHPLRDEFDNAIAEHPLRREIIATHITNSVVNRTGPTFVAETMDKTGMGPSDVARAFIIVRESFGLRDLWGQIEGLDNQVDARLQYRMLLAVRRLVERAAAWVLRHCAEDLDIGARVDQFQPGLETLAGQLGAMLHPDARAVLDERARTLAEKGVPGDLAWRIGALNVFGAGLDLIRIAESCRLSIQQVGPVYFNLGRRLGIAWLREAAARIPAGSHWQEQAVAAIVDDLNALQSDLTIRILECPAGEEAPLPGNAVEAWIDRRRQPVERIDQLMAELRALDAIDVAMLTVANRRLRGLLAG